MQRLVSDLADLYELALSIGSSLNLEQNCSTFFKALIKRRNFRRCSLWESNESNFKRVYTYPSDVPHNLVDPFEDSSAQPDFKLMRSRLSLDKERVETESSTTLWMRGEGFYVCLEESNTYKLTPKDVNQLEPLLERFILSVKACVSHKMLLDEVIRRQGLEDRLYERESMFRFGANSLIEGIVVTDLDDVITYANRAMESITGYKRNEILGAVGYKLFRPIGFEDFKKEVIDDKRKQGIAEVYEIQQRYPSGETYWVRITGSPFRDQKGEIIGTIAAVLDISERKAREKLLEEERAKLKDLFDKMYDAMIIVSADGEIVQTNKAAEKLLGYAPQSKNTLSLADIVHPDDKNISDQFLLKLKEDGFYSGYQGRIITPQGETKYVEVNSTAIYDDKGRFNGSRDIVRDVTQRVVLEKERIENELRLSQTVDGALDAVITIDSSGTITQWNRNASAVFGYSLDDAMGSKLVDLVIPDRYKVDHDNGMARFLKTGEGPVLNKRFEISAVNKQRDEFPIELAISPVTIGGETHFSAFIRDISERRKNEEIREHLISKMEEVNQELTNYAYVISHDMKAPLRAVSSLAEWIHQDYNAVLDKEGKEMLRLIQKRVRRMHKMIDGLLTYSRIGHEALETELMQVQPLVEEVIDSLAQVEGVFVCLDVYSVVVKYHLISLLQIFQNLIVNAVRYNDKEHKYIIIRAYSTDKDVIFEITDNGPGIKEEFRDKIFGIFQTLQSKDEQNSTGIGLSIVKRLVEVHGGRIELDSELGIGSTFRFTVPQN